MNLIKYSFLGIFLLLIACKTDSKKIDVVVDKDSISFLFQKVAEEDGAVDVSLVNLYVVSLEKQEDTNSVKWMIQAKTSPGTNSAIRNNISVVNYGIVPSGMIETVPAKKLTPGLYAVEGILFTYTSKDGGGSYSFGQLFSID